MYDVMKKYGINSLVNHLAVGKFFCLSHPIHIMHRTFSSRPFGRTPHIHDYTQIWYCNSGEYTHLTRTGNHECREGSLIIIPPGCPDDFAVSEGKSTLLTCIYIDPSFFKNTSFSQFPNTIANLFLPNFPELTGYEFSDFVILNEENKLKAKALIKAIDTTVSDDEESNYLPILNLLEELFCVNSFRLPDEYSKKASELSEARVFPIIRALNYINNNFSEKITASKCAEISLICKTNFFKAFRAFTGAPFAEYLKQLRVLHASILLGHSPFSLTYIANLCGYSDAAYMANCMKKYTGRIPKMRKQRMQEYYKQLYSENGEHKSINEIVATYTE